MNGNLLDKKLKKAYGKIGSKVGFQYEIYRSLDYIKPIQPRNFFGYTSLAYSLDDNFSKQQEYSFNLYNLYTDTTNLKAGDIFYSYYESNRFTLVADDKIATPKGILSNNTITIFRPIYNNLGGFSSKKEEKYSLIPAQILSTNSGSNNGNANNFTNIKNPVLEYDIWVWLPNNSIEPRDIITDEYNRDMVITSIAPFELGYKLHCQSIK